MSKKNRIIITLIVMSIGAIMLYIAWRVGLQPSWFNMLIGYVGIALLICSAIYLKKFFPANR